MEMSKILDLENDGLIIATDNHFLYIRSKRTIYKYDILSMSMQIQNTVYKKDGKARTLSIWENFVYLTDFCDLYILNKDNMQIEKVIRIGTDLSSDLGAVRFGENKAYICIRNGKMAVMDICTREVEKTDISESSSWDHCVVGDRIYTGTVNGEVIETDTGSMQMMRKTVLGKKNIYSVIHNEGILYTVSQDMAIRTVSIESFETVNTAKKAVKGMAKILGLCKKVLVVADSNKISLWDKQDLHLIDTFEFPTGHFNKGALLNGDTLYGSDYNSVYSCALYTFNT